MEMYWPSNTSTFVGSGDPALGLEHPFDLSEVQVPAGFDLVGRGACFGQPGLGQYAFVGDGAAAEPLDLVVSQPFGEIDQFPGGGAADVEAGGDHPGGAGVPEPGCGAPA